MDGSGPLKVLLVEDSAVDAELILRVLRELSMDFEHQRVDRAEALREALSAFAPGIILSDFSMPGFSGQEALMIAMEMAPETPFVYVSGNSGEELAIDALQRGATDYVLKDNMRRLPAAVERALRVGQDRRERNRVDAELVSSRERFRDIVETSGDWIWETDASGCLTYNNLAATMMLGYGIEELKGRSVFRMLAQADRAVALRRLSKFAPRRDGWEQWWLRFVHRDGSTRTQESSARPMLGPDGSLLGYRGVNRDITKRVLQEARIRQLGRFRAVLAAVGTAVVHAKDRDDMLRMACHIAVEQGGFQAAGIGVLEEGNVLRVVCRYGDAASLAAGAPDIELAVDDPAVLAAHPGVRAFREKRLVVIPDFAESGVPAAVREAMLAAGVRSQVALPIGAEPWGLLALFSAEAQEDDAEELGLLRRFTEEIDHAADFIAKGERLEYLAYRNPVSGLPNRSGFHARITPLLHADAVVAVLDVRRFEEINRSRGRAFGDGLLRLVGKRLQELAPTGHVLAHTEGDVFLLTYPCTGDAVAELAALGAMLDLFEAQPVLVEGEDVSVVLHGGVAIGRAATLDTEALERDAFAALAEAKRRGERLHVYTEDLQQRAIRRRDTERDLRRAVEEGQFVLYYQPKVEAAGNRVVGAEALVRWQHPERGLVPPVDFIPLLEETGLIVPVGNWVMRTGLETALAWRAAGNSSFVVCVNVSARELRHHDFLEDCRALLLPHAADQPLEIELTESLLMDDVEHSIGVLQSLRELGCQIAIDDFGTGYSSLNYLTRLPVTCLKIDRSFVATLTHSPQTMSLLTNVINLAHSLSLSVVAEGVEEEEQAKLLRLLRCDMLQGYLFGRPLPADEFAAKFLQAAS